MKKLLQDRKTLYLVLGIVIISVFTLSIAYASLSTILEIHGNSEVVASSWDIHLENVQVKNGSVSANVPIISGNSTLMFDVELNTPGDYYEFTVNVVNDGTVDAIIDDVIKEPELDVSQKKFLNYEITYQNGELISNKQTLSKGTSMPIKVRIEYRRDISVSDLPSTSTTLNLKLTLVYVQSDGSGSIVKDNGKVIVKPIADGSLDTVGTIVTIGDQQFYIIGTEGDNVKLLSMYNLYVGNSVNSSWQVTPLEDPTGRQSELARGAGGNSKNYYGTTKFSDTSSEYEGSLIEEYVNSYKNILESDYGLDIVEARLITKDELTDSETFACVEKGKCSTKYPWIYLTSFWTGTKMGVDNLWRVNCLGYFNNYHFSFEDYNGVRPVIVISRDLF